MSKKEKTGRVVDVLSRKKTCKVFRSRTGFSRRKRKEKTNDVGHYLAQKFIPRGRGGGGSLLAIKKDRREEMSTRLLRV